jgi:hypothetical protein
MQQLRRGTGNAAGRPAWRESHRPLAGRSAGEINARRPGPLALPPRRSVGRRPGLRGGPRRAAMRTQRSSRRATSSSSVSSLLLPYLAARANEIREWRLAHCSLPPAPSLPFFSRASARASRGPNTRRSEHRPSERRPTEPPLPRRHRRSSRSRCRLRGRHQPPASASLRP